MKNYQQAGSVLTLTPSIAVASGVGHLFGAALFGVATADVAANTPGQFKTDGVIGLDKAAGLAINVGDRLFWDAANKVVDKTSGSSVHRRSDRGRSGRRGRRRRQARRECAGCNLIDSP